MNTSTYTKILYLRCHQPKQMHFKNIHLISLLLLTSETEEDFRRAMPEPDPKICKQKDRGLTTAGCYMK